MKKNSIKKVYNPLTALLEKKRSRLLSVFFTAGFPELESTGQIIEALEGNGIDFAEVGMPYSDPLADGPVIQQASMKAIGNGMGLKKLFSQLEDAREKFTIPLVLMGYLNPVFQYGVEKFCKDARSAGISGVILPDMPLEQYERNYRQLFEENNLHFIFLITPTTPADRIKKIDSLTTAFIYAVSSSSITGVRKEEKGGGNFFERLKQMKLNNIYIAGFGIHNSGTLEKAWANSAGAITGSAFINKLNGYNDPDIAVKALLNDLYNR